MSLAVDRQKLVTENIPLVGFLASKFYSVVNVIPRDELASAGALALVQASRTFDPSLGVPFSAYASTRINGSFRDVLRENDWASRRDRQRITDATVVRDTWANILGRTPTVEEVAETLGDTVDRTRDALAGVNVTTAQVADMAELVVVDPSEQQDERAERLERTALLRAAVAALPDRARTVIQGMYFEGRTRQEVAQTLGVHPSQVSRIRAQALRLLREAVDRIRLVDGYEPAPEASVTLREREMREEYLERLETAA